MAEATRILACFAGALMVLLAAPAAAHRKPEVLTTMAHVTQDGTAATEITHRLHAHDALHVLEGSGKAVSPRLDDAGNLDVVAAYVSGHFRTDAEAISTLGAEVDGNFVFVYQLATGHARPVTAAILSDVDDGWLNLVNVETDGVIRSLTFSARYPDGARLSD